MESLSPVCASEQDPDSKEGKLNVRGKPGPREHRSFPGKVGERGPLVLPGGRGRRLSSRPCPSPPNPSHPAVCGKPRPAGVRVELGPERWPPASGSGSARAAVLLPGQRSPPPGPSGGHAPRPPGPEAPAPLTSPSRGSAARLGSGAVYTAQRPAEGAARPACGSAAIFVRGELDPGRDRRGSPSAPPA